MWNQNEKITKNEETRSKSHDAHAPKMAEIQHENGQISAVYEPISPKPPHNVFFGSWRAFCEIETKKRTNIEETRSKSHDAHAPKTAEIGHENGWISAVYEHISPKLPHNVIFGS